MNAIGYLRLSMRDQSRYSLEYQESSINEYCKRNNIELLAIFKDNGQSSYNFDRPNYIALESFIKKHKGGVNYLIVMDHDRFSRNLPEALMKIKSLENKFKIKVIATNESPDLDTNDPDVFLNRAFKYLMANNELLRIRQRTSRGIRQALEGGRFVNRAPYGYYNQKAEGRKGIILINEEEAKIIRKVFFDFLLGHPIFQIHKSVKALGYPGISRSAIRRILENCIYAGLIKVPESISSPERYVKGIHAPIVTAVDFWRCQEILGNKPALKSIPKDEVPLRGVLRHSCGASMTAGYSKGKNKYYLYYRCTQCSNINIPGEKLHNKFEQILDLLSFNQRQVDYLVEHVKEKITDFLGNRKIQAKGKLEELHFIDAKIDGLEEKMVNDEIENATYKKWFKKFSVQKSIIQAEIMELNKENDDNLSRAVRLIPALLDVKAIFKKATIFQKHSILREVFKGGLTYVGDAFRTPFLHPALAHNELIIKEKGLLFVEQPSQNFGESTGCSAIGI